MLNTFHDLYVEQLRDLYSAETQIIEALPLMIENASNADLRAGFEQHLAETRTQRDRLDVVFQSLGKDPGGHTCQAMKGIIKEANELISESHPIFGTETPGPVRDAGLIASAQRVEHYEIAAYGTVREFARCLGRTEDQAALEMTLEEEKATDAKLTRLAEGWINAAATQASPSMAM